jgi:WD40 repeat protein
MCLEKRGLKLPFVLGGTLLISGSTRAVPAALMKSTLHAAKSGVGMTQSAAVLMEGALQTIFLRKLKQIGAALVLVGAAGGLSMFTFREMEQPEQPPLAGVLLEKPAVQGENRDLYGDPLPKGAVIRLGTLQHRAVGAQLVVSSDGKSIVGVRGRKYLHTWDAVTGRLRQTHELPGNGVAVPELSLDGELLALAEESDKLAIWDVATGKRLRTLVLKGISGAWCIPFIAFSTDGQKIAAVGLRQERQNGTGRHDSLVRVWDLASGKEIFRRDIRNNNQSYLLIFSQDGQRLLASFNGSQGTYCCCWDISNGQEVWRNKDNVSYYSVVTSDGKILAMGQFEQQKLRAVDIATGQTAPLEKTPPIEIGTRLSLTPDGQTLLVSTAQGVIVWDMVHGKELRTLPGAGEEIAVMPDGKGIITNNGSLQRWDLATGKPLWPDTFALGHIGEVIAVAFSADGTRLASTATDGSVRLWDTRTGRTLRLWQGHLPQRTRTSTTAAWIAAGAKSVDITPDGRRILSAASDEQIKLWDAAEEKEARSLILPGREKGQEDRSIFGVRISPDGARAVALFGSVFFVPKLATWNLSTGEIQTCHPVEINQSFDIMQAQSSLLAPDGRIWLMNGALVDLVTGQEIAGLEGGMPNPRVFSRDGSLVAGGYARKTQKDGRIVYTRDVCMWETATGQIVAQLKTKSRPDLLAFHPNNRFLAASDWDGIHLLDAVSGKVVSTRQMPEHIRSSSAPLSYASCLAVASDGRLATGQPDGTILLWEKALPASKPEPLAVKELETLWTDLEAKDAAKAWRAVWRLTDSPQDALAYLRGRVKPSPTAPADVTRKLLADLDSDSFAVREAAVKSMKELGLQAEPALRAALMAKPSLEQKKRIEELLAALHGVPSPPTPEELRQLRALIVLVLIGTPEARRRLEDIAKGAESSRLTRQARAALACMH